MSDTATIRDRLLHFMNLHRACGDALEWVYYQSATATLQELWDQCPDADWLYWIALRLLRRFDVVLFDQEGNRADLVEAWKRAVNRASARGVGNFAAEAEEFRREFGPLPFAAIEAALHRASLIPCPEAVQWRKYRDAAEDG